MKTSVMRKTRVGHETESDFAVGATRRGCEEKANVVGPIQGPPIGDILALGGERRAGGGYGDVLVPGSEKGEKFARGIEGKIGVERTIRFSPVLAGGEDEKEGLRLEDSVGKRPLVRLLRIIGETVSLEVDGLVSEIVDLDPVGKITVLVGGKAVIVRQEFTDDDLGPEGPQQRRGSEDPSCGVDRQRDSRHGRPGVVKTLGARPSEVKPDGRPIP